MTKKSKRKPDLERLARLTDQIAGYADPSNPDLILRLEGEERMKVTQPKNGSTKRVVMAAVTGAPAPTLAGAVTNWANAARRALLRAEG